MKKKILSILLSTLMIGALLTGCGSEKNTTKDKSTEKSSTEESVSEEAPEEEDVYEIAIFHTSFGDDAKKIRTGYIEALNELLGEGNFHLTEYNSYSEENATATAKTIALNDNLDLILADGETAIRKIVTAERTVPIVGTGVLDYQGLLGKTGSWDSASGRNFTGVSSRSSMIETLSLIIETVPEIKTVGILSSPNDSDSTYQIRILENYMDQAGIPWKEYSLLASDAYVLATTPEDEESEPSMTEEEAAELIENANRAVLTLAVTECNSIFIPSGTNLYDQKSLIFEILDGANLPIITGDRRLGRQTLTCLYLDPTNIGKEAAQMTYDILVEEEDVSTMKFESVNTSTLVKLYQDEVAERFERTFPKTFYDIDEYLGY